MPAPTLRADLRHDSRRPTRRSLRIVRPLHRLVQGDGHQLGPIMRTEASPRLRRPPASRTDAPARPSIELAQRHQPPRIPRTELEQRLVLPAASRARHALAAHHRERPRLTTDAPGAHLTQLRLPHLALPRRRRRHPGPRRRLLDRGRSRPAPDEQRERDQETEDDQKQTDQAQQHDSRAGRDAGRLRDDERIVIQGRRSGHGDDGDSFPTLASPEQGGQTASRVPRMRARTYIHRAGAGRAFTTQSLRDRANRNELRG